MEREMNSKFMAYVFKLRTCESPEEDVLIYLWELIRLSVLVNQLNFLSMIYMMSNVYILSISVNSYQSPKFQLIDLPQFIFTTKTNSVYLAVPSLFCPDERTPTFSRKSDSLYFQSCSISSPVVETKP